MTVEHRMLRAEVVSIWGDASPVARAAAAVLAGLAVLALVAPWGGYPVGLDVVPDAANLGPSTAHWLGTDHLGRDVAWRLALGTRAFAGPGLVAVATAWGLGIPLGTVAGFLDGPLRWAVRWGFATLSAIPVVVLVVLVAAIVGTTPLILGLACGLGAVPGLGELVADRVEELRRAEVVLADRAHGLSEWRIAVGHLVLGAAGRSIARAGVQVFAGFLALETTLSYLGRFGVQEPQPSWGNMMAGAWAHAGWLPLLAPAGATWATLWLLQTGSELFAEPTHG